MHVVPHKHTENPLDDQHNPRSVSSYSMGIVYTIFSAIWHGDETLYARKVEGMFKWLHVRYVTSVIRIGRKQCDQTTRKEEGICTWIHVR